MPDYENFTCLQTTISISIESINYNLHKLDKLLDIHLQQARIQLKEELDKYIEYIKSKEVINA